MSLVHRISTRWYKYLYISYCISTGENHVSWEEKQLFIIDKTSSSWHFENFPSLSTLCELRIGPSELMDLIYCPQLGWQYTCHNWKHLKDYLATIRYLEYDTAREAYGCNLWDPLRLGLHLLLIKHMEAPHAWVKTWKATNGETIVWAKLMMWGKLKDNNIHINEVQTCVLWHVWRKWLQWYLVAHVSNSLQL